MPCDIFYDLPGNVKLPALGYGTFDAMDDSIEEALEFALETGYRHIDTATAYKNEDVVGKVLKRFFDSGKLKREDVFITTKLPAQFMHPDTVEERLKESLRKLQLDYVDLYLIHFPISIIQEGNKYRGATNVDYLDVWKKMEEQHDAGRAKFIGISNFSKKKIERVLQNCRIKPVINQVEVHVYLQQKELYEYCTKKGILIVAYSPLGCRSYNQLLENMGLPTKFIPDLFEDETVKAIAKKYSKTPAQILLRFLLQAGVCPIPKGANPKEITENYNIFDFKLDDQDMKDLRARDSNQRVCDWLLFGLEGHPDFEF